jgi:hypothetical protein
MVDHGHITETITSIEGEVQAAFALPERWRLQRVLGAGGQGEVWLAFDVELQEPVAIKVLSRPDSPTAVERLKREVRVGRKLRHEHLVQVYELVDAGQSMAIVMEYLEGGSLSSRLGDGRLEISVIEPIAEALLEGLTCLHSEGIVHRDVKPSNVLFDSEGAVKLADFGTLRSMVEGGDLTATTATVGTPAYMSPEQVRGEEPAPPSDLYSLGVTLYHLLAGKRPFEGGSEFDVARRQVTDEAPSVRRERPDCPRWLARFVHRLLEKDPKNRWCDAGVALEAFRSRRWRPPRRAVIRGAVAVVVLAVVCAVGLGGADRFSDLRSSVENGELVVRNGLGRTLWRKAIEGVTPHCMVMDLHEERGPEILAAVMAPERSSTRLDLLLFGRSGKLLDRSRVRSPYSGGEEYFPTMTEEWAVRRLEAVDFGGVVGKVALWTVIDQEWYPSVVGVSTKQGARPVFVNSGHISDAAAIDIDRDGRKELVVVGFNNILGNQLFAAVIDISGPDDCSPDLWRSEGQIYRVRGATNYALLGEIQKRESSGLSLSVDRDGRVSLVSESREFSFGEDGAIDGVSADQSSTFWLDIAKAAADFRVGEGEWGFVIDDLSKSHEASWARMPFRAGAALILADGLAEGGRSGEGARLLDHVIDTEVGMRRLLRKAGELRLLSGDWDGGRSALMGAIDALGQGFNSRDELIDLGLDAALHQDSSLWDDVSVRLQANSYLDVRKELQLIVDFFGGRFPECGIGLPVRAGAQYGVHVLKIWAAIESGSVLSEVNENLGWFEDRHECAQLAAIARARALMLEGRVDEAIGMAAEALDGLKMRASTSWPDAVMLPLAEWAVGTIYEDVGDSVRARHHLEIAVTKAPDTFFGQDAAERLGRE